jgi:hypothetical protein
MQTRAVNAGPLTLTAREGELPTDQLGRSTKIFYIKKGELPMTKVLGQSARYIFGLFGAAVLALLMSLTYQALGRIFPQSFANQIWGLVLFDIAAIVWALAFIFASFTIQQYAAAGIGFTVAFVGTLGMVAAEVTLAGNLVEVDAAKIGQWLVYGFIGVTVIHAALLWLHHFGAAEIHQRVELGIARGQITTEATKQAVHSLDVEKQTLARSIYGEIYNTVLRDLGVTPQPVEGTPFEKPRKFEYHYEPGKEPMYEELFLPPHGNRQHPDVVFARLPSEQLKQIRQAWQDYDNQRTYEVEKKPSFLAKILSGWGKGDRQYIAYAPSVNSISPQPIQAPKIEPAQDDAGLADGENKNEPQQ